MKALNLLAMLPLVALILILVFSKRDKESGALSVGVHDVIAFIISVFFSFLGGLLL